MPTSGTKAVVLQRFGMPSAYRSPSTLIRTNLTRGISDPILQVQRILRLVRKVQVQIWRRNGRSRGAVLVAQAVIENGQKIRGDDPVLQLGELDSATASVG